MEGCRFTPSLFFSYTFLLRSECLPLEMRAVAAKRSRSKRHFAASSFVHCFLRTAATNGESLTSLFNWDQEFDHIAPVLAALHRLPVSFRIDFKILLLTFKALHNLAPNYILDLLTPYVPNRNLRSRGQRSSSHSRV